MPLATASLILGQVAALVVDADLTVLTGSFEPRGISVDLPPSAYVYVSTDTSLRRTIEETLSFVCGGYLLDQNGDRFEKLNIEYRIKLLDMEQNWREIVKELIVNAKDSNQGTITDKVFSREKRQAYLYNEMKFGSQAEIRIAQEFGRRKVLFFPSPSQSGLKPVSCIKTTEKWIS